MFKLLTLSVLIVSAAYGADGYSVTMDVPDRMILTAANIHYNGTFETLRVSGSATVPDGVDPLEYTVALQGHDTGPTQGGPHKLDYSVLIPMGPTVVPPGGWSAWAFGDIFADREQVAKPIVAELIRISDSAVVARSRVTIWNKFLDTRLDPDHTADTLDKGTSTEISGRGLDHLEPIHLSLLPQPSAAAFSLDLTNSFKNKPADPALTLETRLGNNDKACFSMDEIPAAFKDTDAWKGTRNRAIAQALLYAATINGPLALAAQKLCVQKPVFESHFEMCVGNLSGTSKTLAMSGVEMTDHTLGTPPAPANFLVQNRTGPLAGSIDAQGINIFFRYKENIPLIPALGCAPRPQGTITVAELAAIPALNDWRSCRGLTLHAAGGAQNGQLTTYTVSNETGGAANPEQNRILAGNPPHFTLFGETKDAHFGMCADSRIEPYAESLLHQYWDDEENSLNSSWNSGNPRTQQARALDKVFSRWETGVWGDINLISSPTGADHILTHTFDEIESSQRADRFRIFHDTAAFRPGNGSGLPYVYSPAREFPCNTGPACALNSSAFTLPFNVDHRFDISYSVTTGALNQILKELAPGPQLTGPFQPTYGELGLTPHAGKTVNDIALLDSSKLLDLHYALEHLIGKGPISLNIRPTIAPFTHMPPDTDPGVANLAYSMPAYVMELSSLPPGELLPKLWLSMVIDFHDPALNLQLSAPAENRLVPNFSSLARERALVTYIQLPLCDDEPLLIPGGTSPPRCASEVAAIFFNPFKARMRAALNYFLSRFPAPLLYDGAGDAPVTKGLIQSERHQQDQIVTFYGNLQ